MRFLFLAFLVLPIIEMYVLIRVGQWIGAVPTIAMVALTAVIGVALLRRQGLSTLLRGQRRLDAGELPAEEMLEGLVLAVGGALLLTPGFVTDAFGFACLVPPARRRIVRALVRRGLVSMTTLDGRPGPGGGAGPGVRRTRDGRVVLEGEVIEGEWERRD